MTKAKMPVTIRGLRPEDRGAWQKLWTAYLEFYKSTVPDEVYDVTFARLLGDDPQDYTCLVAEVDGQLVGLTHYVFHRHNWRIENVVYLQDLYAVPEARGKGARPQSQSPRSRGRGPLSFVRSYIARKMLRCCRSCRCSSS